MRAALVECWRMDRASARQAFGGTMQDVIDRAGEPLKLTVDAGVGEQAALTDLCMQVMRVYSVSDDETHLTDMT